MPREATHRNEATATASAVALALVALLVVRYQGYLLDYLEWGDESETIVVAKMMAAGMSLYSGIFNPHGPLAFLPGYLLELTGSFGIRGHRIVIAALQWAALASIYFSPLLVDRVIRNIYVAIAASVMVIYLPEMYGHNYLYQTLAGLMLIIILAQYTLPAIACPEALGRKRIAAGNLLLGSMPFLAVIYLPLSALLFAASVRKPFLSRALAFAGIAVVANVVFLALVGSLPGYFADHIYFNSSVLPVHTGGHGLAQFLGAAYAAVTQSLGGFLALTLVVSSIAALAARDASLFPWRPLFVGLAIGSLVVRPGHVIHQLAFYYACLALPIALVGRITGLRWQSALMAFALLVVCAAKLSLLAPGDKQRLLSHAIAPATEFSELARAVTNKDERIIAYTFKNYEYIAADRLPASGHFFYLALQATYNEMPCCGIRIDACEQISATKPKAILLDKGTLFPGYPWDSYARCVQSVVDRDYYQVSGRIFYLRKDIAPRDIGVAAANEAVSLAPSRPLAVGSAIPVSLTPAHREQSAALKSIGVLFGTHARQNSGEARLELAGADARPVSVAFALGDLADNHYRFFELPPGRYTGGNIIAATGGGVSTWESRVGGETATTCVIYDYANGKRRFTPGCPLY